MNKNVFMHEDEAVKKINTFLIKMGYTIFPSSRFGVDIKAVRDGECLYCEVKGTQNKFGRIFTPPTK
jgi:hypothetical protein